MQRMAAAGRNLVTTNHVIAETYTRLRHRLGFSRAQQFLRDCRQSSKLHRVYVPEEWEQAAELLLEQYRDHVFSYVDATSFITMQRLGIDEAFAFDQDFVIAGFTPVS